MYPILRRKTLLVLLWHVCDLPRHALITHSWDSQIPTVYHYPNSPCPLARTRSKQSTLILATNFAGRDFDTHFKAGWGNSTRFCFQESQFNTEVVRDDKESRLLRSYKLAGSGVS